MIDQLGIVAYVLSQLLVLEGCHRLVLSPATTGSSCLKLALGISAYFVTNALIVLAIGLLGLLYSWSYLVVTTVFFLATKRYRSGVNDSMPSEAGVWRTLPGQASILVFLTGVAAVLLHGEVSGIDALTLNGPIVVDWVHSGGVDLTSHRWHYPLLWEFQLAPVFLLTKSGAIAVFPLLMAAMGLASALAEILRRFSLTPSISFPVSAFLVAASCQAFPDAFKGDFAYALGCTVSVIGLIHLRTKEPTGRWAVVLGGALVMGSKATGFLVVALLVALAVFLLRKSIGISWPVLTVKGASAWVLLFVFFATPQLLNVIKFLNPVYPAHLEVLGFRLLDGEMSLRSTSILSRIGDADTLVTLLMAMVQRLTWLTPLLCLGIMFVIVRSWQARGRGTPELVTVALSAIVFWAVFVATPFSYGRSTNFGGGAGDGYLRAGSSLRFGLAAIHLTAILGAFGWCLHLPKRLVPGIFSILILLVSCLRFVPDTLSLSAALLPWWPTIGMFLGAALLKRGSTLHSLGPQSRVRLALGVMACVLALGLHSSQIDRRRNTEWNKSCSSLWNQAWLLPPGSEIGYEDRGRHFRYLLYGYRQENAVRVVNVRHEVANPSVTHLYLQVRDDSVIAPALASGWRELASCQNDFFSNVGRRAVLLEAPANE